MVVKERQFAKTFDAEKNEFVIIKSETDLDRLENMRYFTSQINILDARIYKLSKSLQDGTFELSEEDVNEKLAEFERKIKIIDSKIELHHSVDAESKQLLAIASEELKEKVSLDDLSKTVKRLAELEKKYAYLSTPKIKNVFLSMIETVEALSNRAKNVELALSTIREIAWSRRVEDIKRTIVKEKNESEDNAKWQSISNSLDKLKFENKKKKGHE